MNVPDTFGARSTLEVGGESYESYESLPYALKVLLENLLRLLSGYRA